MASKQAYRALFATLLVTLFSVTGVALPYPILAPLFNDVAANPIASFMGLDGNLLLAFTMASYPLGMLIGSSLIGPLSDAYGRRRVLIVSTLLSGLGYFVSAIAIYLQDFPLLLLSRFLTGLCEGNIAISRAIATDLHPAIDKTRSFSWLYAATYAGWLIGPAIGGYTAYLGSHTAFAIAGSSSLLLVPIIALCIRETNVKKQAFGGSGIIDAAIRKNAFLLLGQPAIRHLFFMYLLLTMGLTAFYQFYPLWLVEEFAFRSKEIANATVVQTIAMVLFSTLVVERLKNKIGLRMAATIGLSSLIFALLHIGSVSFPMVFPFFFFTGAAIATYNGLLPVFASETHHQVEQGRLMGLLTSTFCLASVLIAPIAGVASLFGAGLSIQIGGALLLLGGFYFLWLSRKQQVLDEAAQTANTNAS